MVNLLLLAPDTEEHRRILQDLRRREYACSAQQDIADGILAIQEESPDAVLVGLHPVRYSPSDLRELVQVCTGPSRIPVLALLLEEQLPTYDFSLGLDDFQVMPCRSAELVARVQQLLWKVGKVLREDQTVVRCGDLMIDTSRYEVYVAGRPTELTFKEYELLKFLATNQDKVFTREVLLNRVWGYDYFGGARTVDVHIRRLRSKIEDKDHTFIETVRNVGYRFRPSAGGGDLKA